MSLTLETTLTVVRDFVASSSGGDVSSIDGDTLLLQDGHIDSFALVDLIGELERKLGLDLPEGALIPEDFETTKTLFDRLGEIQS